MIDLLWDMETSDPDDFLTLLLLLGHPRVKLHAVTVTPGTPDQVGVVRTALAWFNRTDVAVGAHNLEHPKRPCVSQWHYDAYGELPASRDAEPAGPLLRELCARAGMTLVTGAALKNLGAALKLDGFSLDRLVVQGGFAGDGVVPVEKQLEKFRGRVTCPTFNLNGDPKSALAAIASKAITKKRFVSKNVCHGVVYDEAMHERFGPLRTKSRSLELIYKGMSHYLRKGHGKAFHDPLAACCAIDESIATWAEVDLYRAANGEWGSKLAPGSGVNIIVGYDPERFFSVLTEA
ncbi:MAG: nucleoside hydrolase [Myxococcaceae bacterium]